jgi:hypothetical protein
METDPTFHDIELDNCIPAPAKLTLWKMMTGYLFLLCWWLCAIVQTNKMLWMTVEMAETSSAVVDETKPSPYTLMTCDNNNVTLETLIYALILYST